MNVPQVTSKSCCIVCKKESNDLLKIGEIEDARKITSILGKITDGNVQQSDVICSLCADANDGNLTTPQQCENSPKKKCLSTSQESPQTVVECWNKIIVNQIPLKSNGTRIDRQKFISLFSPYGIIEDVYLSETVGLSPKCETVGIITFRTEDDAWRVWDASQEKMIKYDEHVLMITIVTDNFCPIQDLPDDCLRKIFLQISSVRDKFNVEAVCDRWKSIARKTWSSVSKIERGWMSDIWETIISRTTQSIRDVKLNINEVDEDAEDAPDESIKCLSLIDENLTNLESFAVTVYIEDSQLINPHLCSIISKNKFLKQLYLWWVDFDDAFINFLPAGMEQIKIIAANQGDFISEPVNLSRFKNLQVLALMRFVIEEGDLEGIECLENLRVLKLNESDVNSSNIEKIVNFTKLEHLAIPNCQISDVALAKILVNNKGLKHLDISDIEGITDFSFQHVSQLSHLQVLLMENLNQVTDTYFTAMPKLTKLNCSGCTLITDVGIQRLFTPDSMLEQLGISDCSITLDSLRTAYEWTPPDDKFLLIFVNKELAEASGRFEIKKASKIVSNYSHVLVGEYNPEDSACRFSDPVFRDWDVIFEDSVRY